MNCRDFVCEGCGKTFHTDSSTEEMIEENAKNFPEIDPTKEDMMQVCDDCYKECLAFFGRNG